MKKDIQKCLDNFYPTFTFYTEPGRADKTLHDIKNFSVCMGRICTKHR